MKIKQFYLKIITVFIAIAIICGSSVILSACSDGDTTQPGNSEPSQQQPEPEEKEEEEAVPEPDEAEGEMTVHFIDVGQGDAVFIDNGDYEVLVDAGTAGQGQKVSKYINQYIDGDLNLVIGTHNHADHIGGLDEIIEDYKVDKVIDSGDAATTKSYKNYINEASNEKGCKVVNDKDMTIDIGNGGSIEIIEAFDSNSNANDNSVVALVTFGGFKMLLAGDSEKEAEANFAGEVGKVDVFKADHHGSATANSMTLLNNTQPSDVVISAGLGNSYHHPHLRALKNFKEIGATVYGTFISGTIVLTTDGTYYSFDTNKKVKYSDAGDGKEDYQKAENTDKGGKKGDYIGNSNTKKFHRASCGSVKQMSDTNKVYFKSSKAAKSAGYIPCKRCNP